MTALARSAPLGHLWPIRGLLRRGPTARVRTGASGRKRGRARNGPGLGARSAVLERAQGSLPPLPRPAGRIPPPRRGGARGSPPTVRAGDPPLPTTGWRSSGWGGGRVPPPPTPPGEGGAGPRPPAARLRLPAWRCPEAGSASWVSVPFWKIAPRTRSLGAPLLFRSGDAWRETRPLPRRSSI